MRSISSPKNCLIKTRIDRSACNIMVINPLSGNSLMIEVVEIPVELTQFQLPQAVQDRLQLLLDRQDQGQELSSPEQQEAEGLVELAEFLSLLRLRATRVMKQA